MPDLQDDQFEDAQEDSLPSKSERKRQMHALQRLGESLLELNDQQLADIPIEDEQLLRALHECRRIRSNSAKKRQLQFIGKLMRKIDSEAIETAISRIHQSHRVETDTFHALEQLREDILAAGQNGIELAMRRFPQADRQHLRQLVLQHQREVSSGKPPAASRKLFRYLRELQETYGESD